MTMNIELTDQEFRDLIEWATEHHVEATEAVKKLLLDELAR